MGKTKNSGLCFGTNGFPQATIFQGNVERKALHLARMAMLEELKKAGVKFTAVDVLFVTKDRTGQLIWLEKGNDFAGLKHILMHHSLDFINEYKIKEENIVEHIRDFISYGTVEYSIITDTSGKKGYERLYKKDNKYYSVTGIGTNGFIVSAYPINKKKALKYKRRAKNAQKDN